MLFLVQYHIISSIDTNEYIYRYKFEEVIYRTTCIFSNTSIERDIRYSCKFVTLSLSTKNCGAKVGLNFHCTLYLLGISRWTLQPVNSIASQPVFCLNVYISEFVYDVKANRLSDAILKWQMCRRIELEMKIGNWVNESRSSFGMCCLGSLAAEGE